MGVWERVQDEFACECAERIVVRRETSDRRTTYCRQCTRCGASETIKKAVALFERGGIPIPAYDPQIAQEWSRRKSYRLTELRKQEANDQSAEWWSFYTTYLESDRWRVKREAVLKRDNWICQACLTRKASQAHHLTYKHVGDEPLFELIAVCVPCHEKITAMDRKARR